MRVLDLVTDLEWVWSREKFLNRKCVMEEMFAKFEDGEKWQPLSVSVYQLGSSLLRSDVLRNDGHLLRVHLMMS